MLRSFLSVSVVFALGVPLALVVNILLARWLSLEQFGLYSFAISAVTLLAIPISAGLPLLLTREVSAAAQIGDEAGLQRVVSVTFLWVAATSALLLGLVVVLGHVIERQTSALLTQASLMLPGLGMLALANGGLKGLNLPAQAEASRQLVVPPMLAIGALILSRQGTADAHSMLYVTVVAYTATGLVATAHFAIVSPLPLRPNAPAPGEMWRWGSALLSFALVGGMATLSAQLATLVLGTLGSPSQVAFLRVAERGAQLIGFPLMFINAVIGPHVVQAHREGTRADLHALSRRSAWITTAFAAPMALVLIFFGRSLIGLTFGPAYVSGAYLPLVILCLGQLVGVIMGSPGMFLVMCGFERQNLVAQGTGLAVLAILTVALSLVWGEVGAALGVTIGTIATKFFAAIALRRKYAFFSGIV